MKDTVHAKRPSLLVISSAPVRVSANRFELDKKFVEGMRRYADGWNGAVTCLLRENLDPQPFSRVFERPELGFGIETRPPRHHINEADLADYDVIMCNGDNSDYLHLAQLAHNICKPLFFSIENIPATRQQIIWLDQQRSVLRKVKSTIHMHLDERRRRRAFAMASGLQANGYPAAEMYRAVNRNVTLYLDNRIDRTLLASAEEMAARRSRILSGGPLNLIHSGRLEPIKGSGDLIPLALRLRQRGVAFRLDIFGSGSLEDDIRRAVAENGLDDQVILHGSVDFSSRLVPFTRQHSDIFISCHRQSDPSCTYLESMGCGVAIAGYDNQMWAALAGESQAGWVAPLGNPTALADVIADAAKDRTDMARRCDASHDFASRHLFEAEFGKCLDQMATAI